MKPLQILKRWLNGGCVYFTVIALFMLLLNLATLENAALKNISPVSFLRILPAALTVSAAGLLLKWQTIPRWARLLSHYALIILAFFVFLWRPLNPIASPSTTLIVIVILTAIYWLVFLLVHLIGARIRRLMEED